ncbi:MAG TPA: autotransporter-associated beta strand repeat-containing protein, partial [Chlorobaculum sp.]|nr:autotransporter-associated beta strand repeat-containing protein [Chlorobaculum sp.]
MNRIHRIIWSKIKERWIVVSEKSGAAGCPIIKVGALSLAALLANTSTTLALAPGVLPTGGQITAGSGTITTSGSQMTVTQSTAQMIANWDTFNIGESASVRFAQPTVNSTALNCINDQNPSQIFGSLSSNGNVFLINTHGIIFSKSSKVDVGGLVASTLNLSDNDFLNGNYSFTNSGNAGKVVNQGTITAGPAGVVALIAPKVINEGSIVADKGSVAMLAGDKVTLDFKGDGLIRYTVDKGSVDALAENNGLIQADGGKVVMNAEAADALTRSVVSNSGVVKARTIENRGGRIVLVAGGGQTTVSGTLDASSADANGGTVIATGDRVLVTDGAHLTASGATGGGSVLVGGSWQNSDKTILQATGTVVEAGALLEANATDKGNGGTVVAWSDVSNQASVTRAYGTFEAKGGPNGGDGGRIETSGHWLDVTGSKGSASATFGNAGEWLFDPYDVTITSSNDNGTWSEGIVQSIPVPQNGDIWTPNASGSTILNTDIQSRLDAGTNVKVTTTGGGAEAGNITVNSSITTGNTGATRMLTLDADGNIILNGDISNTTGTLNLFLNANGGTISGSGNISGNGYTYFNVGNGNGTYSGAISDGLSGSRNVFKYGEGTLTLSGNNTFTGGIGIYAGTLSLGSPGALGSSGGIIFRGGILQYSAANNIDYSARISAKEGNACRIDTNGQSITFASDINADSFQKQGTGILTLKGNNSFTNGFTLTQGTLSLGSPGALGSTGSIVVNGGILQYSDKNQIDYSGRFIQNPTFNIIIDTNGQSVNFGSNLVISSGSLTKLGEGTLTLSGYGNQLACPIYINSGTLQLGSGGALNEYSHSHSQLYFGGGTLQYSANNNTDYSSFIRSSSKPVSIDTNGQTVTFATALPDNSSLIKTGLGTLILTGSNTYTGTTTVSAGTLQVGNGGTTGKLGTGTVTTNADLVFNRSGDVSLSDLAPNSAGIGGSGNVTALIGGNFNVDRTVSLTGGSSKITLASGVNVLAGITNGGDVTLNSTITTSNTGTISIFQGNPNTNILDSKMVGASGETKYKYYNVDYNTLPVATSGTRNFYYRKAPLLTVSGLTATKTYDGNTNATNSTITGGTITGGYIEGDSGFSFSDLTLVSGAYGNSHAGTWTFSASYTATTLSSNGWFISGYGGIGSGVGTITQKALTASIAEGSNIYGSTVTPGNVMLTGLVDSDVVTATSSIYGASYSTSSNLKAGSYQQTVSSIGGTDASNYSFSGFTTSTQNYTVVPK